MSPSRTTTAVVGVTEIVMPTKTQTTGKIKYLNGLDKPGAWELDTQNGVTIFLLLVNWWGSG